eukprot:3937981-Rhodomonas_salina.2
MSNGVMPSTVLIDESARLLSRAWTRRTEQSPAREHAWCSGVYPQRSWLLIAPLTVGCASIAIAASRRGPQTAADSGQRRDEDAEESARKRASTEAGTSVMLAIKQSTSALCFRSSRPNSARENS